MDIFEIKGQYYSVVVDRFSSWLLVFHYKVPPQSKHIIHSLRSVFTTYGTPAKIFTDGGLQFQSMELRMFLQNWSVTHITSSASYPQANGRAELGVKTAKRLLQENTAPDGSLNCNKASRALLQYRNTPIQHLGLSPAQILYHRNLKDGLPTDPRKLKPHKKWVEAAMQREEAFSLRNKAMQDEYNRGTRVHGEIAVGSTVAVQETSDTSKHRWSRTGTVVERMDRKYTIRMHGSGRVITRNRKHIKVARVSVDPDYSPLYYPTANSPSSSLSTDSMNSNASQLLPSSDFSPVRSEERSIRTKTPLMKRRLRDHNKPGLTENAN